jgi:hypothetical protein
MTLDDIEPVVWLDDEISDTDRHRPHTVAASSLDHTATASG